MTNYKQRNITPFIFAENTTFEGKLLRIKPAKSYPNYIFQTDQTEMVLLWGSKMLNDLLFDSDIGKQFQITYNGKDNLKNGNTIKNYTVSEAINGEQKHETESNKTQNKADNTPF